VGARQLWLPPLRRPRHRLSKGYTSTTTPLNPFRYTAKRYDTGSATYDMGARRFGPDTNRFLNLNQDLFYGALDNLGLSTDPLTANRYALAAGNPISYAEWDGHMVTADNPVSANPELNIELNSDPAYTPTPAGTTNGSATQRASAHDQAPDINRDQEGWEKQTRTRLGDYLRAHPATSPSHPLTTKRS
jgi:RHS repeat-associated protein